MPKIEVFGRSEGGVARKRLSHWSHVTDVTCAICTEVRIRSSEPGARKRFFLALWALARKICAQMRYGMLAFQMHLDTNHPGSELVQIIHAAFAA